MLSQTKKTYTRKYHPMLVSNNGTDEKMDSEASLSLWEKFDHLPREIKMVVSADEAAEKISLLQEKFHLNDISIGQVTLLIRKLFFSEIELSQMEARIGDVLTKTGGNSDQAKTVVDFIKNEILTIKPQVVQEETEEKPIGVAQIKIDNISIGEALVKYPKVGEQSVTVNPLKLRYFPNPVRPSIKNWITDFHDNMGSVRHSSIDRGNYIFHSENGKKLTPIERQKISILLKSLEEGMPMAIDQETQTVIFENTDNSQENRTAEILKNDYVKNTEKDVFERYSQNNQMQKAKPSSSPNFAKEKPLGNENYFSNFASKATVGNQPSSINNGITGQSPISQKNVVSFSSPQKLAVEQQKPEIKTVKQRQDSWVIKPSENGIKPDQQGSEPRITGNTVDLRG